MIFVLVACSFEIDAQCILDGDWDSVDATCPGANDGSICCIILYGQTPGTGIGPYSCSISPTAGNYNATTNCFNNLPPNNYTVTTTSSDGCIGVFTNLIVGLTYPAITATFNITAATCGASNGSICATVVGGSGSYGLSWTGPPSYSTILSSTNCLTGFPAGQYQFYIDDLNTTCSNQYTRTITGTSLSVTTTQVNSDCVAPNCNGSFNVNVLAGTSPYQIHWTQGGLADFSSSSSTFNRSGLCPGTYAGTVTDANGCNVNFSITITLEGADVIVNGTGIQNNVITGNVLWNAAAFGGQSTIIVDADVLVQPGATLTVDNLTVLITPAHVIRGNVTNGNPSHIYGFGSTFDAICGPVWHGFEILASTSSSVLSNRASLDLVDCNVYHADCAIRNYTVVYSGDLTNTSFHGGIINCENTLFQDNVFDLNIRNNVPPSINSTNYSANFKNCIFRLNTLPTDNYLHWSLTTILQSYQRIFLMNTSDVRFMDCTLENTNPVYANSYTSRGLVTSGANFQWIGTDPYPSGILEYYWPEANYVAKVRGFRRAFDLRVSPPLGGNVLLGTLVTNTLFQNHQNIVSLDNISTMIANNIFRNYASPLFSHADVTTGSAYNGWIGVMSTVNGLGGVVLNPQQISVFHNYFYDQQNSVISGGVAMIGIGGLDNFIVENYIESCRVGIGSSLRNRYVSGSVDTGLRYECNYFKNIESNSGQPNANWFDIYLYGIDATIPTMGSASIQGRFFGGLSTNPLYSAGNKFLESYNSTYNKDDINTFTAIAPHSYRVAPSSELFNPTFEMTTTQHTPIFGTFIFPNSCGYNWRNALLGLNENIIGAMQQSYLNKQSEIQILKDGGNTESLISQIDAATYSGALELYQSLLSKTPALSEESMIAAIQKEYELPKPMLTQILASNPQAAKSAEVLSAIEQRQDPLDSYQTAQIMSGQEWFSELENLEIQAAGIKSEIESQRFQLLNTQPEIDEYLSTLNQSEWTDAFQLAELLIKRGALIEGKTALINSLGMKGNELTSSAVQTYVNVMEIEYNVQHASNGTFTSEELSYLNGIFNDNTDGLGYKAIALLIAYAGYPEPELSSHGDFRCSVYEEENSQTEIIQKPASLWPNPASDFTNLKLSQVYNETTKVVLRNMDGTAIYETLLNPLQVEMTIDTNKLPVGRYHITIHDNDGSLITALPLIKN